MATRCPVGKILRKGYTTKRGTRVTATCVPDKGKKGKGPKTLPKPKRGGLRAGGKDWGKRESATTRHGILKKVVKRDGCRSTIGKLVLLRNITTDQPTKRAAKADEKWLRKQGFCKLKTKKRKR